MTIDNSEISWNKLKAQKITLMKVINTIKDEKTKSSLDGILNLIDYIQDEAVNDGVDENEVFINNGFYIDIATEETEFFCAEEEMIGSLENRTDEETGDFGKVVDGEFEAMGSFEYGVICDDE